MNLARACVVLQDLGYEAMRLHRDHVCSGDWSHTYDQCPRAPYHAHSALELAEVETEAELRMLVERKAIAWGALVGALPP